MRKILFAIFSLVLFTVGFCTRDKAHAQTPVACQFNYSFVGGVATATYCGNLSITGLLNAGNETIGGTLTLNGPLATPFYAPSINVGTQCGADVNITSGTYNTVTGAVSITLSVSTPSLAVGQSILVSGLTGTGAFASLNGYFTATAGTGGTVLNYTAATGLGATTITGGKALVPTGFQCLGGSTANGLIIGNLAIGNQPTGVNAYVGINADNDYANINQETREGNFTVRHGFDGSHADEAGLGWDTYAIAATNVIQAYNWQNVIGNVKGGAFQFYFEGTAGHPYSVKNSYNLQANIVDLDPRVTLTNWAGLVVNGTAGGISGGIITTAFEINLLPLSSVTNGIGLEVQAITATGLAKGIDIQAMSAPSASAIRVNGTGVSNALQFNTSSVYDDGVNHLVLTSTSGIVMTGLPASAGGGGLFVCVDTSGFLYKKATCP